LPPLDHGSGVDCGRIARPSLLVPRRQERPSHSRTINTTPRGIPKSQALPAGRARSLACSGRRRHLARPPSRAALLVFAQPFADKTIATGCGRGGWRSTARRLPGIRLLGRLPAILMLTPTEWAPCLGKSCVVDDPGLVGPCLSICGSTMSAHLGHHAPRRPHALRHEMQQSWCCAPTRSGAVGPPRSARHSFSSPWQQQARAVVALGRRGPHAPSRLQACRDSPRNARCCPRRCPLHVRLPLEGHRRNR